MKIKITLLVIVFLEACTYGISQKCEKEYWNTFYKNSNQVILTQSEIKEFNKKLLNENDSLIDFKNLPDNVRRYKNKRFGIAVHKGNVRAEPTDKPVFEDENDTHFDTIQYKELKFGEPVVLLKSKGEWDFVWTYNVQGWVKRSNLAFFENYKKFLEYVYKKNIAVITAKSVRVNKQFLDMGVRLVLLNEDENNLIVKFPVKDIEDKVFFVKAKISKKKAHVGFLSYTKHNFIKQVFKYLGTPYGWGGRENGVDCSGLALNVYSTFGFEFPRNSFQQQQVTKRSIIITSRTKLKKELNNKKTGSLLFFPGHIMIYLGKRDGENYIIHAIAARYDSGKREEVMRVIVSDLNIIRKTGKPFKDEVASVTFIGK